VIVWNTPGRIRVTFALPVNVAVLNPALILRSGLLSVMVTYPFDRSLDPLRPVGDGGKTA